MRLWERFYPFLFGIAALAISLAFGGHLAGNPDAGQAIKRLYGVLLNVTAIYTGFLCNLLFTLHFASTVTLDKARNTQSFRAYMAYVHEAFVLGFVAAAASVPMVVFEPVPSAVSAVDWQLLAISAWTGTTVWSLAAVLRIGQAYLSLGHR